MEYSDISSVGPPVGQIVAVAVVALLAVTQAAGAGELPKSAEMSSA